MENKERKTIIIFTASWVSIPSNSCSATLPWCASKAKKETSCHNHIGGPVESNPIRISCYKTSICKAKQGAYWIEAIPQATSLPRKATERSQRKAQIKINFSKTVPHPQHCCGCGPYFPVFHCPIFKAYAHFVDTITLPDPSQLQALWRFPSTVFEKIHQVCRKYFYYDIWACFP